MSLFERIGSMGHEQVVFCSDRAVGLSAIIAVHSTALGPSLGGVRVRPYPSEEAALDDVLRLSRAMSFKAAVAGLDLGGGKAVIIGERGDLTEGLVRSFARHVQALGGRYIASIDMNTSSREIDMMSRETSFCAGRTPAEGGLGEPGPVTAWGVYHGIRAALQHSLGSPDVRGRVIAVQGLGSVGWNLSRLLHEQGARLIVADVDAARVRAAVDTFGATSVAVEAFTATPCDVLSPCAIGGVLDDRSIAGLQCRLVAGGANNVLADEERGAQQLADRGITFAPDYVVNAGGIIAMHAELKGRTVEAAMAATERIFHSTLSVLSRADADRITTVQAARHLAEDRMRAVSSLRSFLAPKLS